MRSVILLATLSQLVGAWIEDAAPQRLAAAKRPEPARKFQVNLDLPAKDRWTHVFQDPMMKTAAADVHKYFQKVVPKFLLPLIEGLAKHLTGHFHGFADEITGIADALNMSTSDIALINLAYSLQEIGNTNCTMDNTTGPCMPKQTGPQMCTSFVAESSNGTIWHGRNLDWDLDDFLREYIFDVEFMRGGKPVFTGTTIAGLVGVLHGMKTGGFSISLNARQNSGNPLENIMSWLVMPNTKMPTHLMREVLDGQPNFETAVKELSSTRISAPSYFIVAGASHEEGAIITHDRLKAADVWRMGNDTSNHGTANDPLPPWLRLQTNYDHWAEPPKWDDRRHPGIQYVQAIGQEGLNAQAIYKNSLTKWPTFNHHTDVSAVMSPTTGSYMSIVWRGDGVEAPLTKEVFV